MIIKLARFFSEHSRDEGQFGALQFVDCRRPSPIDRMARNVYVQLPVRCAWHLSTSKELAGLNALFMD